VFAADPIDTAEAQRIGLINQLVPAGQALVAAQRLAEHYKTRGPLSLAAAKLAVHRGLQMDRAAALEFETDLVTAIYATADKREGIAAFLEKRPPRFRGA
jgi:enoyl-CoA hydratase/carnithine racemase